MAEITLEAAPILGGVDIERAGCRLVERDDLALVSLAIPLGGLAKMETALKDGFGLTMPEPLMSSENNGVRALQIAPDQLMLLFPHATPDADPYVAGKTDGAGYTTDQTDVWVRLELSGEAALSALERLCPLDLHESVFPLDAAARTTMEHMGTIIIRTAADRFLLLSASSSARSFLHAVETTLNYIDPKKDAP